MDGPVGAAGFAELPGPVERVDDPEAAAPRDVLEPLLGADVVLGIEAIQLLDEELMGQPIPGHPHVPDGGPIRAQLEQGVTGHGGQRGRVTVLGGQILLFDGGHDDNV